MSRTISSLAIVSSLGFATLLGVEACTLNTGDSSTAAADPHPAEDESASKKKAAADSGAPLTPAPTTSAADAGADAAPAIDESKLYEGTWTYQDAAALVLVCPGQPANIVDLAKAGKDGKNATFELSLRNGKVHEVDGLGCEYDFGVVDHSVVTESVQTCGKYPDGRGGFTLLTTDITHKTTRDGRTMNVAAHAKVGPNKDCDLYVEGHAVKTAGGASIPNGGIGAPGMGGGALPTSGGGLPDERDRYAAKWFYERGSALVVACPGQPASVVDLSVADQGKPGAFVFAKKGVLELHETDGAGCEYDFSMIDGAAVVTRTQTCNKLRDARGNATLLTTITSRKTSWDGANMVVSAHAKVGASSECDLFVEGTAKLTQ